MILFAEGSHTLGATDFVDYVPAAVLRTPRILLEIGSGA
jgi:hypothetical protein